MKRVLLALAFAVTLISGLRAEPVPPVPAPTWSLTDLAGNPIGSKELKGKVVVVDFWATWCPPCRGEMPGFVDLSKKYAKDGLVIVGISMDQTGPSTVKKYVDKYLISYPVAMGDEDIWKAFGGNETLPMTVIINRDGKIVDRKRGAAPTADFEKTLLAILK